MHDKILPLEGNFFIGCNYWASHAGTSMWSDWQPETIDQDFRQLSEEGVQVLRVFPLWSDFQPIHRLYGVAGTRREYRFGEASFLDNDTERSGVSKIMMNRFHTLIALAEKYDIKLIVGLITGWMSGRLFVPSALEGKAILTDPESIKWQNRFVRYFVKNTKNSSAIIAWDLGNECNCIENVETSEEAWLWTSSIANAIKIEDQSRPLISGMHSLSPVGNWTMQDQGELTDILTTHPYPLWTPHVGIDPINTVRPIVHATAESLYYSGLGGKPCFAEEMGTMGPMISSDEVAGNFARASMFSLWSHACHGMLWWCAYDQTKLDAAPYEWIAVEGELGLIREDRKVKPTLIEMHRIKNVIDQLPFETLPPRKIDGVCIINTNQDHWASALGSFILSKQANVDIEFQYEDQPLKDSNIYLLPSISGVEGVPRKRWKELLERVANGATLYISMADGFMLDFQDITGLQVETRSKRRRGKKIGIKSEKGNFQLELFNSTKLSLNNNKARIIGTEEDGNICFSKNSYGKGEVYFLSYPIELNVAQEEELAYHPDDYPYWKIYREVFSSMSFHRLVKTEYKHIGITEHELSEEECVIVIIHYASVKKTIPISLKKGWKVKEVYYGEIDSNKFKDVHVNLQPNEATIFQITKQND
ncbi:glycoside hydrolase 5 family protein [Gracilibacillus kekensis]|uniref:Endo-1,4-beta-mannosidase n=1 Tax=Gracilibacillus kekensis TaxID=1027249 RepID=A0A1M7QU08_9BACI|nr:beta-mannanase [Gracilibacillus kekensis]SHN34980.1 Endo-1,4-beta-mannosidase [Gracilibacillus kekensis]